MLPFCERLGLKDAFEKIYESKCSEIEANRTVIKDPPLSGFIVVAEEGFRNGPIEMPFQQYSVRSNEWTALERFRELADLHFYGLELVDRQLILFGGCVRNHSNRSIETVVNRVSEIY